jgi:type IV pilus assembly protein PilQ
VQVAIEAMILSVTLDDKNSFGVDFSFSQLHGSNPTQGFILGTGSPLTDLATMSFADGGVKLGFLDGNIGAFLNALESIGDVNVVATPRLTVMNKQKAEVLIGKSQGYTSSTAVSSGGTTVAQMTMLDTGTILRLRPNVSSDGLIRMDVHPELSDGTVTAEAGLLVPTKTVTQVTSNVMVRDGCTIIIGGLMRETLSTTSTQLPILGSLPVIGALFRDNTEEIQKEEILVLITPHIIYDRESGAEGSEAACDFHRRQQVYREKMSPIGKRSIARCYFRLAQNAWAAGDRQTALRFAEMAVHFDPLNRAAIDLRATIWQGLPEGKHTLRGPGVDVATPAALDGRNVADWVLDDLEQESKPQPPPSHPLDPGQPGRHSDLDKPRRLQ